MRITPEQREAWVRNTAESPFNQWLDGQVRDRAGALDLAKLHELALRYGVDKRTQYAGLNPGQQRMNIGNALRRVVPRSDYLTENSIPTLPSRPTMIRDAPIRQLLEWHGNILDELRHRKVVRTANGPVGDYAELLFSRAFGWILENNSASGFDAVDDAGVRYQIKARRLATPASSRQMGGLRHIEERKFDRLAAVLLRSDYQVGRAAIIPYEVVKPLCRFSAHTNASRFILDESVWLLDGVRDVTAELAGAADALGKET